MATYGDPSSTWMFWHMRAIARATGLPRARMDQKHLSDCLDYIDSVVAGPSSSDPERSRTAGQERYHRDTARRSENIERRFERLDEEVVKIRKRKAGGEPLVSDQVTSLAFRTARLMVDEVLEWRAVFLDRILRTP